LTGLRAFCTERRWSVLGLHQDLSTGYPVAPLLGARSAQAELALVGDWCGRSALVASVLVRKATLERERRPGDHVVQLTTLDSGPLGLQFTAERLGSGLQTAPLGTDAQDAWPRSWTSSRRPPATARYGSVIGSPPATSSS
jgi:hypothetical protein